MANSARLLRFLHGQYVCLVLLFSFFFFFFGLPAFRPVKYGAPQISCHVTLYNKVMMEVTCTAVSGNELSSCFPTVQLKGLPLH